MAERRVGWMPGYWTTRYVVVCLTVLVVLAVLELAW